MSLSRLRISEIRNIHSSTIQPAEQLNLISGENGSGKTSLLESISILATGKSFRSNSIRHVINRDVDTLVVYGEVNSGNSITPVGVERKVGSARLRVGGRTPDSLSELATLLPLQFIGPDLQKVLEQGPKMRRSLLDWGVFHVEHHFFSAWSRYNKLLKQRNALLKRKEVKETIAVWDRQVVTAANALSDMRSSYLDKLLPLYNEYLDSLLPIQGITVRFNRGWSETVTLEEVLVRNMDRDLYRGFTQYGPHRADLIFKADQQPVSETLSRGQLKLIVIAFKLAQVDLMQRLNGKRCVILLDDLPAELDQSNRLKVLDSLLDSKAQLFITCTDPSLLEADELMGKYDKKMFHVEHGLVTEVL